MSKYRIKYLRQSEGDIKYMPQHKGYFWWEDLMLVPHYDKEECMGYIRRDIGRRTKKNKCFYIEYVDVKKSPFSPELQKKIDENEKKGRELRKTIENMLGVEDDY